MRCCFKSAANIYPSNNYDFFPIILLLTNHEALYKLDIVLSFHPHFDPGTHQPLPFFTITGLCPVPKAHKKDKYA